MSFFFLQLSRVSPACQDKLHFQSCKIGPSLLNPDSSKLLLGQSPSSICPQAFALAVPAPRWTLDINECFSPFRCQFKQHLFREASLGGRIGCLDHTQQCSGFIIPGSEHTYHSWLALRTIWGCQELNPVNHMQLKFLLLCTINPQKGLTYTISQQTPSSYPALLCFLNLTCTLLLFDVSLATGEDCVCYHGNSI